MNYAKQTIINNIDQLLDIGIALSSGNKTEKVLELILKQARVITNADAGSIYFYENGKLNFKIMQNDTINLEEKYFETKNSLPAVSVTRENVVGYAVIADKLINIEDVYNDDKFDFSGPKKYDRLTGYKTTSMLVIPLKNIDEEVIGVLQLINAKDEQGNTIPFAEEYEKVFSALASQAAITISNFNYLTQIENLLDSFVKSIATAIDARTKYNTNHTKKLVKLVNKIIELINNRNNGAFLNDYFNEERKEQLIMAAWLHDVGKVVTPLTLLNKASRLGDRLELVLQRLDYIRAETDKLYWQKKFEEDSTESLENWYNQKVELIKKARRLIIKLNSGEAPLTAQEEENLKRYSQMSYIDGDGKQQKWLTEYEVDCLMIKRGTLTAAERSQIEEHVKVGKNILQAIPFLDRLKKVPDFVYMHHELLDGSGYPEGLSGNQLPLEVRILTLVDIFEALTASDRPYRNALSIEKALNILGEMVKEEKLDARVFNLFKNNRVWECLENNEQNV
ncbi:HD-GYP domain-containing protein (c-di-GMP phosphodiesterase class II) [Halanaerobium saccharolyticum]|uniref:HD-GYP domain-containing protein (C-di-GMP phosphodiesterase class II) n=1 Tax=Halanaerobium saccharolyticum TaxID=43595 RepID=A0A4R6M1Z2_9FIRM|nr:HD domain-containing phosphohydrolase [Halanaerobium saccharolyticum]TDO95251.1 HD-GYP domain-containing protein (c-di-GMP phosphodiesterase class II) [Halanaerobium saccharolyticum]